MSDKRPADEPHHDLAARCEQLEREIDRLRSLLNQHGIAIPAAAPAPPTVPPLTSHLKLLRRSPSSDPYFVDARTSTLV
jgi:hypothetical protein